MELAQLAGRLRVGIHHQVQADIAYSKAGEHRGVCPPQTATQPDILPDCSNGSEELTAYSFERCLTEPVANRPDDILEGVLIRFLHNLKPGLRSLE